MEVLVDRAAVDACANHRGAGGWPEGEGHTGKTIAIGNAAGLVEAGVTTDHVPLYRCAANGQIRAVRQLHHQWVVTCRSNGPILVVAGVDAEVHRAASTRLDHMVEVDGPGRRVIRISANHDGTWR